MTEPPVKAFAEDGVDALPHVARLVPLSLQHVLIMYAGAVTVPLVVGRALGLPASTLATLISADLVACGLATLIQSFGVWRIGIRLPIVMGVTFASVSPMLALIETGLDQGRDPITLLRTIYGAVIVAGVFGILAAPLVGRMSRLFPPAVTGSVILVIGLSLIRVATNWSAGGLPGSPDYGALPSLGLAFVTLLAILLLMRFGPGFLRSGAVLFGIAIGAGIAAACGMADFSGVRDGAWVAVVRPFQFGLPLFEWTAILAMCLVMTITLVESFGMFLAAGEIVGRPATQEDLVRGLRGDGLGTLIGGVFNTFPYTSFAQNVGLLTVTGVKSRYVCVGAGVILVALGLVPKLAEAAAAVPVQVLGGAGLVMFGMIAATGVAILTREPMDFAKQIIVAVSVSLGLIPVLAPDFFGRMPEALAPLLHSGILLTTISAILLNIVFGGRSARPGGSAPLAH